MAVRKLMDFIFSPIEMYWLDHMLPGEERIKREDEQVNNRWRHFPFLTFSFLIFKGSHYMCTDGVVRLMATCKQ